MDIYTVRRANLNARIQEMGGQVAFIQKAGINQGQISELQRGKRNLGEKQARSIELKCGWPAMCLDSDGSQESPIAQIQAALDAANWLNKSQKDSLIVFIESMRGKSD